jgi:putative phosphoribosyl transferase
MRLILSLAEAELQNSFLMKERFRDRLEAGELLGSRLRRYANREDVIVLGLPRGGVPVAAEVARKLNAPLDVFIVRKLGVPGHRELAMGAIASGGRRVLNEKIIYQLGIPDEVIAAVAEQESEELHRREDAYRGDEPPPEIQGKIVTLVDDGIATGSTMRAALQALHRQQPRRVIIAVPVAPFSTCGELEGLADELVVLTAPHDFYAVGEAYEEFSQTSDEEVTRLLREARGVFQGEKNAPLRKAG